MKLAWRALLATLVALTILLHIAQIVLYPPLTDGERRETRVGNLEAAETAAADAATATKRQHWPEHQAPPSPPPAGASTASSSGAVPHAGSRLMLVTATQPSPCTTRKGDHILSLSVKNKWQYATMHGHRLWLSTELLSAWDLAGQWNKVALLATLMEPGTAAGAGADWLLWVDDDILFSDMEFEFPLARYEANEEWLVLWGDDAMTYGKGDTEGVNTGTMLLRVNDWSRALLAAMAELVRAGHDIAIYVHIYMCVFVYICVYIDA